MTQLPAEQAGVAFARLHVWPQLPQLAALVWVLVSQPLAALPSQSPKPVLQVKLQVPAAHVGAALVGDEQTVLQFPQWLGSVWVLVSQPSICLLLLQSAKPAAQVPVQLPLLHRGVVIWLEEQTIPHPPQLFTLLLMLVSQPLVSLFESQSAKPALQAPLQTLLEHVGVLMLLVEQMIPHPPQLLALVWVFISQPSVCLLPLQSA
jgi:hypothetical protein